MRMPHGMLSPPRPGPPGRRHRAGTAPSSGGEHGGAIDLRFLQLRTEFAVAASDDERINRRVLGFVVHGELEAFSQQRPQHLLNRCRRTASRRRWAERGLKAVGHFRDQVVVVRRDPAGAAGDLQVLQLVGVANQQPQRDVGCHEATRLVLHHDPAVAGVVRFDRRDFERPSTWRRSLRRLGGQCRAAGERSDERRRPERLYILYKWARHDVLTVAHEARRSDVAAAFPVGIAD